LRRRRLRARRTAFAAGVLSRRVTLLRLHLQAPLPRPLLPPAGVVRVIAAPLDLPEALLSRLAATLSPDEAGRAARFATQALRDHFTAGRGLLRALLSLATGTPAQDLRFDYGPEGKPRLAQPAPSGACEDAGQVSFNASHSKGVLLFALARSLEVGVDLERVQPRSLVEISDRFFHPDEAAWVRSLPEPLQREGFFSVWSAKEAFIKCTGKGLSQGLASFKYRCGPRGPEELVLTGGDDPARYSFVPLEGPPGFRSALVAAGRLEAVEQYAPASSAQALSSSLWG
jgi:4'-phosphopantetheinyl transferase